MHCRRARPQFNRILKMKKHLLFIVLCCIAIISNAQQSEKYIKLTPDGFKALDDKEFCIVQTDKSAIDMYNEVLLSLGRLANSPKDVISKVENKQIAINAYLFGATIFKFNGIKTIMNAQYQLTIEFKDNRVRIFMPEILGLYDDKFGNEILFVCTKINRLYQVKNQSIFDYKTKALRNEEQKNNLENSFNTLINSLLFSQYSNNSSNDNW